MNDELYWNTFVLVYRNYLDTIKTFERKLVIHKNKNNFQKSILKTGNFCKYMAYENYTFSLISPHMIILNEYIYDKHYVIFVVCNNK